MTSWVTNGLADVMGLWANGLLSGEVVSGAVDGWLSGLLTQRGRPGNAEGRIRGTSAHLCPYINGR
jgi:hypothetical protein